MRFDATGKVSLDHIYNQPDPRAYFTQLSRLDYCVPQLAKPYFAKLIEEYRAAEGVEVPKIVDVGCSYGINAALLKYDVSMEALYARYCDERAARAGEDGVPEGPSETSAALLARDRQLARSHLPVRRARFVGLDTSGSALSYALEAGFVDDVVHADLENEEPTGRQRAALAGADLVVSTGCIGYVTERTLTRIVHCAGERRPWMAHFVLRMFPYDPIERALGDLGYETVAVDEVHRQRRFASPEEQAQVLRTMEEAGVDARGLEDEGWLYARLHLSRPSGAATRERPRPAA